MRTMLYAMAGVVIAAAMPSAPANAAIMEKTVRASTLGEACSGARRQARSWAAQLIGDPIREIAMTEVNVEKDTGVDHGSKLRWSCSVELQYERG